MTILRQIIQLLSESPGSIVYRLVTLFALQAVMAISYSHWRRSRGHQIAARSMVAAAVVFVTQLIRLVVSLVLADNLLQGTAVIPLMEQAFNTLTVFFIVWALAPRFDRLPHLEDLLLLLGVLVVGAMSISFAQTWQELSANGIAYNSTTQAKIWGLLQLFVLIGGLVHSLSNKRFRNSLSPTILSVLLVTHAAHFFNFPEILAAETNVTYWIRLGNLIAFPIWAVFAYRNSLLPLLIAQRSALTPAEIIQNALHQAAQTILSNDQESMLQNAVSLAASLVKSPLVAIGTFADEQKNQLHFTTNLPQPGQNGPLTTQLTVSDWSPLQAAINQNQTVELRPDGAGAGQLHRLYEAMGTSRHGAMVIRVLREAAGVVGVLLLAEAEGTNQISNADREMLSPLTQFLVTALSNLPVQSDEEGEAEGVIASSAPAVVTETAVSGRIIALEESRKNLQEQLQVTQNRLQQAEKRSAAAGKRAHDLAAALEEFERINQDERVTVLEQEVETLRESLIEAEEAMALASAGEGGLSSEWVMLTITRYSGQLEEAQARIEELERQLMLLDDETDDPIMISLVQELRTPMTSIAGFTDLMLTETVGILGVRQRDLLKRVKANTERMEALLEQIVQHTIREVHPVVERDERIDVREVLETAVSGIITQVREKRLNLDMDIAEDLPPLAVNRQELHQIMNNLLGNACQVTETDGRIMISVTANTVPGGSDALEEQVHYLHLAIKDTGGGIAVDDLSRVFDPQHSADLPLIAGLGDTGAGLYMARSLTEANGGRIWLESEIGKGSTFSLLFPVPVNGAGERLNSAQNGQVSERN